MWITIRVFAIPTNWFTAPLLDLGSEKLLDLINSLTSRESSSELVEPRPSSTVLRSIFAVNVDTDIVPLIIDKVPHMCLDGRE